MSRLLVLYIQEKLWNSIFVIYIMLFVKNIYQLEKSDARDRICSPAYAL